LDNISNLWDLGLKDYKRPTLMQEDHLPPIHETGPTFTTDNPF